jgi:alpha-ketoglutaric semialdehyde dehydrogenase
VQCAKGHLPGTITALVGGVIVSMIVNSKEEVRGGLCVQRCCFFLWQCSHLSAVAAQEGARRTAGGEQPHLAKPGYYVAPTLLADTKADMRVNCEEIFGPVASLMRIKDYEEALAVANAGEFGLSAGICTTSLKYAQHFMRHVRAGMTMINLPTAGIDYHLPFGGTRKSSYGPREQGAAAGAFCTPAKTSYT